MRSPRRGISRNVTVIAVVIVVIIVASIGYVALTQKNTSTTSSSSTSSSTSSASIVGTSQTGLTTVRVSEIPSTAWITWFVAQQEGIFNKLGINVVLEPFQSGSAVMTALAAGQADMTDDTPGLIVGALNSGAQVTIIGNFLNQLSGGFILGVGVGTNIQNVSQLNGASVAISSKGSTTDVLCKLVMNQYHINFTEVAVGNSGIPAAITSGNVQAGVLDPQHAATMLAAGQVREVLDLSKTYGSYTVPYSVLVVSNSYLKANTAIIQKVMLGLAEGVAFENANLNTTVQLYSQWTKSSYNASLISVQGVVPYLSQDQTFNVTQMVSNMELQNQMTGAQVTIPSTSQFVNMSFVPVTIS